MFQHGTMDTVLNDTVLNDTVGKDTVLNDTDRRVDEIVRTTAIIQHERQVMPRVP